MNIIRLKESPQHLESALKFIQDAWGSDETYALYDDCIRSMMTTDSILPEWYVAMNDEEIVGCVGLITNDFISRMDLWPWLCALYVVSEHRNKGIAKQLIDTCLEATKNKGFETMYLCTDHTLYYERYDFEYIGEGYHPWGESSRIYKK